MATRLRRPASRMVLVARRIVVEREGIKLAILANELSMPEARLT